MSQDPAAIRIDPDELYTPEVDRLVVQEQAASRYGQAPLPEETRAAARRMFVSSMLYLTFAGALGGFLAWAMIEPHFEDHAADDEQLLVAFLIFALNGGLVGLLLAAAEGVARRQPAVALRTGLVAGSVGFVAGLASMFGAGMLFVAMNGILGDPQASASKLELMAHSMLQRSPAWVIAGAGIGVGLGVARRSGRVTLNGAVGGAMGGLVGGLLFDPVDLLFGTGLEVTGEDSWLSRAVGMTVVGAGVGFFTALVELVGRRQWLEMVSGPLRGKQFILYRFPTCIGSSPDTDIYLFKDAAVEPRHAEIQQIAAACEIISSGTRAPIVVNARQVRHARLADGDFIQIGETRMRFGERKQS